MRNVLIQRRQAGPLSGVVKKPKSMADENWEELELLAMPFIRLHLADNLYFTVLDCDSAESIWKKLCRTYEKEMTTYKVYLMRKLYDLRMKDTDVVAFHLNDFGALWPQLQAQKTTIDDELHCAHSLPHGIHFAVLLAIVLQRGSWTTMAYVEPYQVSNSDENL